MALKVLTTLALATVAFTACDTPDTYQITTTRLTLYDHVTHDNLTILSTSCHYGAQDRLLRLNFKVVYDAYAGFAINLGAPKPGTEGITDSIREINFFASSITGGRIPVAPWPGREIAKYMLCECQDTTLGDYAQNFPVCGQEQRLYDDELGSSVRDVVATMNTDGHMAASQWFFRVPCLPSDSLGVEVTFGSGKVIGSTIALF